MTNDPLANLHPTVRSLRWIAGALVALVALAAACSSGQSTSTGSPDPAPTSGSSADPSGTPGMTCSPTQFVGANDQCFETSDAACASLSCASGCEVQETAPARAVCRR